MSESKESISQIIEVEEYRGYKLNVDFYKDFLTREESNELYKLLESQVNWTRPISSNRRSNQTYGDDGLVYEIHWYGKVTERKVYPWSDIPILKKYKKQAEQLTCEKFNICAIQYYPNGKIGIKKHRDKEMTKGTMIAGVSIGEPRALLIEGVEDVELELLNGSMYVFNPPTNDYNTHCIKEDDTTNPRMSLTFRNYS